MAYEVFIPLEFSEYGDMVGLNEYNGMITIVSARQSKGEGTTYMKWGFPQNKDREPTDKAIPWGIRLGNRRQAAEVLKRLANELARDTSKDEQMPLPNDDDDIPF